LGLGITLATADPALEKCSNLQWVHKFTRAESWDLWTSQLRGFDLAPIWWKAKHIHTNIYMYAGI